MTNKTWIIVAVVLILLVGGFLFIKSQKSASPAMTNDSSALQDNTNPSPEASSMQSSNSGAMTQGQTKEFTVTGSSFKFDPNEIKVNKGDTVKITFKNAGGMHNFVIDEFKVATQKLATGGEETVTFTADKAGSFEYYCSVANHRAMGMKGTLVVQ